MNLYKILVAGFVMLLVFQFRIFSGSTSASMSGTDWREWWSTDPGATVVAKHEPGTVIGTTSLWRWSFQLNGLPRRWSWHHQSFNLRSRVNWERFSDGQTFVFGLKVGRQCNVTMKHYRSSERILSSADRTGASTDISEAIGVLPTVNRDLRLLRLTQRQAFVVTTSSPSLVPTTVTTHDLHWRCCAF